MGDQETSLAISPPPDSGDLSGFERALAELRDRLAYEHDSEVRVLQERNFVLSAYLQERERIFSGHAQIDTNTTTTSSNHNGSDEYDTGCTHACLHQDDVILQERADAGISPGISPPIRLDGLDPKSPLHSKSDLLDLFKPVPSKSDLLCHKGGSTSGHLGEAPSNHASQMGDDFVGALVKNAAEQSHALTVQACRTRMASYFALKECWTAHLSLASMPANSILEIAAEFWCTQSALEDSRHPAWSRNVARKAVIMSRTCAFLSGIMLHPFSRTRMCWSTLGLVLLMYDFITVPIDFCFGGAQMLGSVQYVARIYWTLDICLNFMTAIYVKGVLVIEPKVVAMSYLKSWLLFDVILVTVEWVSLAFQSADQVNVVSIIRGARWTRMIRFMSLMQFVRFSRVKPLVFEFIGHSSEDFAVFMKFLACTVALIAVAHVAACVWYLVGDSDDAGWVRKNVVTGSVGHRYSVSLDSVLSRIHGALGVYSPGTTTEMIIDIIWLLICFIGSAVYIGLTTQVVICWANSDCAQLQKLAEKFVFRHRVSRKVDRKTQNFLSACRLQGIGEMLADERKFLRVLPIPLQEDLQYESRAPVVASIPYLLDLNYASPRVMRHLCYHALTDCMAIQNETVFAPGDPCRCAFFVADGSLTYRCANFVSGITSHECISEAILWTRWEHIGTLKAVYDSLLLHLDAEKFSQSIIGHKLACAHAVKYAQVFVYRLNHTDVTDVTHFMDLDLESLDEQAYHLGSDESHLIFLSHYKAEAGTEATLMRDALEQILTMDPSYHSIECVSPVFVDSEDLVDLARLKSHVEGSGALVLLLTPNIFTRPWCLFEISVAFRSEVRIVPVEVQRPGIKYQYPDESFFRRFEDGLILAAEDQKLLEDNGFAMPEVVAILRHVFKKIAIPFSPHKSWNVRHAELIDILKRCIGNKNYMARDVQASQSKILSTTSYMNMVEAAQHSKSNLSRSEQMDRRQSEKVEQTQRIRQQFRSHLNEEDRDSSTPRDARPSIKFHTFASRSMF